MKSYAATFTGIVVAMLAGATATLAVEIQVPDVPNTMLGKHPNWADIPDLHFYCQNVAYNNNDRINVTLSHKDALVYVNDVKTGGVLRSNAYYDSAQDAFGKSTITIINFSIAEGNDWILADNAGTWYYHRNNNPIYKCLNPSL